MPFSDILPEFMLNRSACNRRVLTQHLRRADEKTRRLDADILRAQTQQHVYLSDNSDEGALSYGLYTTQVKSLQQQRLKNAAYTLRIREYLDADTDTHDNEEIMRDLVRMAQPSANVDKLMKRMDQLESKFEVQDDLHGEDTEEYQRAAKETFDKHLHTDTDDMDAARTQQRLAQLSTPSLPRTPLTTVPLDKRSKPVAAASTRQTN